MHKLKNKVIRLFQNYSISYVFNLCLCILLYVPFHSCSVQSRFTDQDVIIELERTRCMGTCPVYHIKINSSGMVLYEGKEHTDRTGLYRACLPDTVLSEMIIRFMDINFFQLRDVYIRNVSDLPTTYITFRYEGGHKRIMDYYDAPPELRELEEFIDRCVKNLDYRKTR